MKKIIIIGGGAAGLTAAYSANLKYKGGADEEDIVVKLPDYMTESVEDLRALKVPSNTGGQVPLEEVANIERTVGQTAIVRMDQSRVVTISSDVYGRDLGSVSNDIKKA